LRNIPPVVVVFIFFFFLSQQLIDALNLDRWSRGIARQDLCPGKDDQRHGHNGYKTDAQTP
ncbi:MAG: hypothetical protein ACPGFC_01510, partial [Paracoccaceae bacterium]